MLSKIKAALTFAALAAAFAFPAPLRAQERKTRRKATP